MSVNMVNIMNMIPFNRSKKYPWELVVIFHHSPVKPHHKPPQSPRLIEGMNIFPVVGERGRSGQAVKAA